MKKSKVKKTQIKNNQKIKQQKTNKSTKRKIIIINNPNQKINP